MLEVVGTSEGEWSIKVLGSVTIHQSMCYGSEVQPVVTKDRHWNSRRVYVSTSFYDKLLCVWT